MKRPALIASLFLHGTLIASAVVAVSEPTPRRYAHIHIQPFEQHEHHCCVEDEVPMPEEPTPAAEEAPMLEEQDVETPHEQPPELLEPARQAQETPLDMSPEQQVAAETWLQRVVHHPPVVTPTTPPSEVRPIVAPTPPPTDKAKPISVLPGQNPAPEYPRVARRRRLQGETLLLVTVDAKGQPLTCKVARSSGHPILDQAAVATVRRWRFDGGPGQVQVPIRFVLR